MQSGHIARDVHKNTFQLRRHLCFSFEGEKDCSKGQLISSSRLDLLGCYSSELFCLCREDLLWQLGSALALLQNSSLTMKMQARKMSEVSPCSSRHHRQLHYYLSSLFHIKRFCWFSFQLSWDVTRCRVVADAWSEFKWVQGKLGCVCSTFTLYGSIFTLYGVLVWKNTKKKGVRLMYSFPSKTFSAYGASHRL